MKSKDSLKLFRIACSNSGDYMSSDDVSEALDVTKEEASKLLNKWSKNDLLFRLKKDLYTPVPNDSEDNEVSIEDPWILAERLFSPCYIGGWSAASFHDLTEQIFESTIIVSSKHRRDSQVRIGNLHFLVSQTKDLHSFGLMHVWKGSKKILVSDPTRTVIDCLSNPKLAGGIRMTFDISSEYVKSVFFDPDTLLEYAEKLGNRTVFKRLGFFFETTDIPVQGVKALTAFCKQNISSGISSLDPSIKDGRIVKRWNLKVPHMFVRDND